MHKENKEYIVLSFTKGDLVDLTNVDPQELDRLSDQDLDEIAEMTGMLIGAALFTEYLEEEVRDKLEKKEE